ncbi:MAG TPA: DCC1-like thiol-disulfide oxidoreductase family protein [Nitrospiraceae bacterium]|nr:DCC1-like thiol-disulfide oxidoreductase family protein [Nitrospiraceae bacterium]
MAKPQRILIYDGQCRLCVTAKEMLERRADGNEVRFVPYQSEEAARCLRSDYKSGRPDAAFLVEDDGTVTKGLDAFVPLLPGLRGGRALLALWRVPWLRQAAYLLYDLIARHRYRLFGRTSPRL